MEPVPLRLAFDGGTLLVSGADPELLASLPGCRLDPRCGGYRAEAYHYRAIVESLRARKLPYRDEARSYQPTSWRLRSERKPFPHQAEALEAWWQNGGWLDDAWRSCDGGRHVLSLMRGSTTP